MNNHQLTINNLQLEQASLAYIIYTSGSTGKPKGTMIHHNRVVNILFHLEKLYPLGEKGTYLLKTNYTFDVSVTELFAWFFGGGRLAVLARDAQKDPTKILEAIQRYHVTHINFVPALFNAFVESLTLQGVNQLSTLRYIFLAGEELLPPSIKRFRSLASQITLENIYGPTEATIYATKYSLKNWNETDKIPIGKPLANVKVYIFDKYNRLQPIGIPGELGISGEGAARGYLNKPELTAEKFCLRQPGGRRMAHGALRSALCALRASPCKNFSLEGTRGLAPLLNKNKVPGKDYMQSCNHAAMLYNPPSHYPITPIPHHPLYLTGDLTRWLFDGNIEFLGRMDFQVKIRGVRIELGEIENHLLNHENIKEAVVAAKNSETDDRYLCAYFVASNKDRGLVAELKEFLSGKLPGYMVPLYFVQLEKFPLTPNSKIDRKALPEPQWDGGDNYVAPRDKIEKKLVKIWSKVLGRDASHTSHLRTSIGIDDSFFHLGGHSLKATILITKIHQYFNVKLSLAEIFKQPTIRGLAEYIKEAGEEKYTSIKPIEEKDYYPLSSPQKRLYILQQIDLKSTVYHISQGMELNIEHDKANLEGIFWQLIRRHESFRTSFITVNEEPVQRIKKEVEVKVEVEKGEVTSTIKNFIRPFDLSRAPLLRMGLLQVEKKKHFLLLDMHHIISDGSSMDVLMEEFQAQCDRKELSGLRIQYKDYARWQTGSEIREWIKDQEKYWIKEFSNEIPVLNLTTDYTRPAAQSFEGGTLGFEIEQEQAAKLKNLALEHNTTLFMVLLSIVNILLSKLSNQENIVIGTPTAGRRHADLQQIIGMFVNTLALRNYPRGKKPFIGFLSEVKMKTLEAFENQDYPFEELVEKAAVPRDAGRNPLFDVMLALQNINEKTDTRGKPDTYQYENGVSRFDMAWIGIGKGDRLSIEIEYCTKLFKGETIKKYIDYFKKIVAAVITEPDIRISRIEIIPGEERKQVLYDFNDTKSEYPRDKTIYALFKEQVERTPDHITLVGPSVGAIHESPLRRLPLHQITYKESNERANQLAPVLREKGVGPDTIVGIKMERSIEMIISILGILKDGGAYLPIDPEYPEERINYMLADSAAKILLTADAINRVPTPHFLSFHPSNPSNLAYIVYTSGSTGRPKGVLVQHQNVVRLVKNSNFIDFTPDDRLLLTGAIGFDITTFEIWLPLLNGLTLFLVNQHVILDADRLGNFMVKNKLSILHLTPGLFNQLAFQRLEIFAGLTYFLVGGDLVRPQYINMLRNTYKHLKILHMYGPTENTTFSTFHPVNQDYDTLIPIGKPISNSLVYIVDKFDKLVPIGIPGELLTGGDGTARGYLNKPELTAEKFYLRRPGGFAPLVYRTGDLARWLPDGNIEFLGRKDQQVKIRGYRIEIGEIENRLLDHPHVKETVVTLNEDEKEDRALVAYIVPDPTDLSIIDELRQYLSHKIPGFMIPSYFIRLDNIPLTPNGKADLKALPAPGTGEPGKIEAVPRGPIEKKLVNIWAEVLKTSPSKIGIDSNFFALGGHSLKATIMAAKIYKELGIQVPLAEIFKGPTIRQLSASLNLNDAVKDRYTPIEAAEKKEYYPLSSAQERFYVLQRVTPGSSAYNMAAVHQLEGHVEKERFEHSIKKLIKRHETLRTSFQFIHGQPVQRVQGEVEFKIEYHLAERKAQSAEQKMQSEKHNEERYAPYAMRCASTIKDFIRPFNLSQAPLLRLGLIKISPDHHILMFDMHHIISDGTSMNTFLKEFMAFYAGDPLQPLPLQYKDFARWQYNRLISGKLKKKEAYWMERFTGDLPVLNIPTDFPRPAVQSFAGDQFIFTLEKSLLHDLNRLIKDTRATLFMILVAVYNILLSRYTSQEDIITGTTTAGRFHPGLQDIIGLLIETLALRHYPVGEQRFNEFLKDVKQETLAVYENQDYPFKELIKNLGTENEISRNPVFDAMLIVQNIETVHFELEELTFSPYQPPGKKERVPPMSKVDFTLTASGTGDEIYFNLVYCTSLYKRETMERFAHHFINIIREVTAEPAIKLSAIRMIDAEEKKQLLEEFNASAVEYTRMKAVHELFADQAKQNPDYTAVVTRELPELNETRPRPQPTGGITYKELNWQSNQLAHFLNEKGIQPDTIVGIMVEPSVEMIIGLLGILKSGAAYLPIDPDYPEERINYMLADSSAKILVTVPGLSEKFKKLLIVNCQLLIVNETPPNRRRLNNPPKEANSINNYQLTINNLQLKQASLAYIIYTSGSTGRPKGVMVEHHNLTTYIDAFEKEFHLRPEDTVIQQASYTFDASVEELYPILLKGGKLAVPGKEVIKDIHALCGFIAKHQVTLITCSPQLLNELNKFPGLLTSLRVLISGGDRLNAEYIENLLSIPAVYNTYGPTEATVCATYYRCPGDSELPTNVPIGKPITNYRVYILNKYANLLPVGAPGELCIAGGGITRGYLNRPELTAEKFCLRQPGGGAFLKKLPPLNPPAKTFY
ncbi:amino acid adenylation domain-containing protein [Acidobacteriota bacterium]